MNWDCCVVTVSVRLFTFLLQEPFEISQGISGSPISYTLTYFDPFSQVTCGQFDIMANMCINGTCIHKLNVSMLPCPHYTNISVEVYTTNVLGNGSATMSHPSVLSKLTGSVKTSVYSVLTFNFNYINTDRENNILFVKVNFTSAEIYRELEMFTDETSCVIKILYGPKKDCLYHYLPSDKNPLDEAKIVDMFNTDKVDISYLAQNKTFCFVAVALRSNATEYAVLHGEFKTKSG